jgi:hypothetical protein
MLLSSSGRPTSCQSRLGVLEPPEALPRLLTHDNMEVLTRRPLLPPMSTNTRRRTTLSRACCWPFATRSAPCSIEHSLHTGLPAPCSTDVICLHSYPELPARLSIAYIHANLFDKDLTHRAVAYTCRTPPPPRWPHGVLQRASLPPAAPEQPFASCMCSEFRPIVRLGRREVVLALEMTIVPYY